MEAPQKIQPQSLADYLEVMCKAVFHSGMSWAVVEAKWPDIKAAMRDFDPVAIAFLSEKDLDDLAQDKRVIRNRRKLAAIVKNAQVMRDLEEEHGSFQSYLRSHSDYDAAEKDLRKRFGFLGEIGIYYFLYVVGEDVPEYDEWCAARGRQPHN